MKPKKVDTLHDEANHMLHLVKLFKETKTRDAITYIKKHNIDPNYSDQHISDYAALWLKEPDIIKFFKKIIKMGGNPLAHHSVLKNSLHNHKFKAASFLLENGCLDLEENKEFIIYIINGVTMDGNLQGLKLLEKYIDIFNYKFTIYEEQNNPTILNLAISYCKENLLDYIFEKIQDKNIYFSKETANNLERCGQHGNNDLKEINSFKNMFCNKLLNLLKIDSSKLVSEENVFESGDITVLLKVIEMEELSKELKNINKKTIIKRKL